MATNTERKWGIILVRDCIPLLDDYLKELEVNLKPNENLSAPDRYNLYGVAQRMGKQFKVLKDTLEVLFESEPHYYDRKEEDDNQPKEVPTNQERG